MWIPNNEILKRDGVKDSEEAARTYLHGIVGDVVEREDIDAYLDRAPEMLSFVLKNTPLTMTWVLGYSDYYPEGPRRPPRVDGRSSRSPSTPGGLALTCLGWSRRAVRYRSTSLCCNRITCG